VGVACLADPYLYTEWYSGYMVEVGGNQSKIVQGVLGWWEGLNLNDNRLSRSTRL
jgi:hypothetical protein